MNPLKKLLAVFLAVAAVFALCAPAAYGEADTAPDAGEYQVVQRPAFISAGSVKIREEPGLDKNAISEITYGKEIFVLGKAQDSEGNWWFKFNFTPSGGSAKTGWVMAKYCNLVLDIGMVTAGAVNVRESASTSGARIGGLTQGDAVYIYAITTTSDGDWYKIDYDGSPAYVQGRYVGIMKMPENNASARYKNYVTAEVYFENVPNGYKAVVDGKTFVSEGSEHFTVSVDLGQLADSRIVFIRLYDAGGRLKGEKAASIEVDTTVWGKISSFFGFLFNGFKWNSQTVEIV